MTREKSLAVWEITKAFGEGKALQRKTAFERPEWKDVVEEIYPDSYDYRIKPEPKLRAWRPEEVPIGAAIKGSGPWRGVILYLDGETITITPTFTVTLREIAANNFSYSTDNGKTWKPCGVEE